MPDLLVLDVELGQEDGLELLPTVARRCHVAVLTSRPSAAVRTSALRQGARLVLGKSEPAARLLAQLNGLLTGTAA
jgi:DNA-binding NarL/FixJ family response regulator